MTNIENFVSIARRRGFSEITPNLDMCPYLQAQYNEYIKDHPMNPNWYCTHLSNIPVSFADKDVFLKKYYKDKDFKPGTDIDIWGVAHEPGSEAAYHMTYMHNPMANFDSVEQIEEYPFPVFHTDDIAELKTQVDALHKSDKAAMGDMACTIWETSWYMRGMENLFCDMMSEDDMATVLLDKVTDISTARACAFARAGVDGLFLGDDIGMQHTIMMSEELYGTWIKPRLKKVIDSARAINPNLIVFYHSCGHVTELIPQLIEAGIDVLDPVQPECMDFKEIHDRFGDQLSFRGTIGTQSIMPHGTPDDVRKKVFENLDIAGKHGGLFVSPTHKLEPDVPLENVIAYLKACEDYTK